MRLEGGVANALCAGDEHTVRSAQLAFTLAWFVAGRAPRDGKHGRRPTSPRVEVGDAQLTCKT
jgi:hypothetical protein